MASSDRTMTPSTSSGPKSDEVSDRRRSAPPRSRSNKILRPNKELPDHTAEKVRKLAKKRLPDHDKVAAELAPLLGLGKGLLATQRAASLFQHRGFRAGVAAFEAKYLDTEGLKAPLPEWRLVWHLLRPTYPDLHTLGGWDVNYHYARFVARVLATTTTRERRDPASGAGAGSRSQLIHWVRDAAPEDAWWALFHALLYLQLETMRDRFRQAPLRHRIMTVMCPS
ncbi:hypothetical protein PG985_001646 [Apiospora marii]|uniref:uncharacterized protein n=1 Tax=Apiospora marii TaxID=335849 RepID=UPI00312EE214